VRNGDDVVWLISTEILATATSCAVPNQPRPSLLPFTMKYGVIRTRSTISDPPSTRYEDVGLNPENIGSKAGSHVRSSLHRSLSA